MNIEKFSYSDIGPRSENQDSLEVKSIAGGVVACIADGVGGRNCGKIASSESVKFFLENLDRISNLDNVLKSTHKRIKQLQVQNPKCQGMATTFTACLVESSTLRGVHIGDSRLCILRGNGIKQLTEDHTEVNRLVKSGQVRFQDASNYHRKHILESALGIKGDLTIQLFDFKLEPGDQVLITSDGVHDIISKLEFRDICISSGSTEAFGNAIIKQLKSKKITDNTSFLILSIS